MSLDPNRPIVPQPYNPVAPEPMAASSVPTSPVAPAPVTAAPPPVIPAKKKSSGGGRWLNVVLGVAVAVAIAGVAFAVGRTTAPASAATGAGRGGFGGALPRWQLRATRQRPARRSAGAAARSVPVAPA